MKEFKKLSDFEKSEVKEKTKVAIDNLKNALKFIDTDWLLCNLHLGRIALSEAIFEAEKNCTMCQSSRNVDGLTCARKFKVIENPRITCCDDFEIGEVISGL